MLKIRTIYKTLKQSGVHGIAILFKNKFYPQKRKPIIKIRDYISYFNNKQGIEIGGPSDIFSNEIPIYQVVKSLDGCNFSNKTVWEGKIIKGLNYNYYNNEEKGIQYICEASNLNEVLAGKYDFLLASHCLEHCANTLKTVKEWLRVLKKGGAILLVLPDKRYTFDNRRKVTTYQHLIEDYNNNINETDLTHIDEIIMLHDLDMDPAAGTLVEFKKRTLDNYANRCLHHHVFNFDLLKHILNKEGVKIIDTTFVRPYHQIILGIKK